MDTNHTNNQTNTPPKSSEDQGREAIAYPNPVSCAKLTQRDQRALIFQLLYAADLADYEASLEAIAENISREYGFIILAGDPVFTAAAAVISQRELLDQEIHPLLANWRFDRLGVVTRLLLRYAIWEMMNTPTPAIIVINEAVELAQCFAERDAYRFVNGILDEWLKKHPALATPEDETSTSNTPT